MMCLAGCGTEIRETESTSSAAAVSSDSHLETLSYTIAYEGRTYDKELYVCVPAGYDAGKKYNVLYLMHGSAGDAQSAAEAIRPVLDAAGADMLAVFPTYYPDRSFVVSNYAEDYPLNAFFGESEIETVMDAVDRKYSTYRDRDHRAFGGYSMGGITAWEVMISHPEDFAWYMPMAGDIWHEGGADAVRSALTEKRIPADDIHVLAMCGDSDGTRTAMEPQIESLREDTEHFNEDNLQYWNNPHGTHSLDSFTAEVSHGLSWLFQS